MAKVNNNTRPAPRNTPRNTPRPQGPQGPRRQPGANEAKPGQQSKPGENRPGRDGFKPSEETKEGRQGREARESREAKDAQKPEDTKALESRVSDLQRQLEELRNGQKDKQPQSQSPGNCGGSKKPEQPQDGEKKDPDSELQQLALAALAARAMGGQQQGMGNGDEALGALREKVSQLKGQGFQPKGETRAVVSAVLGQDPFGGNQKPGQNNRRPGMVQGMGPQPFSPPPATDFLGGLRRPA